MGGGSEGSAQLSSLQNWTVWRTVAETAHTRTDTTHTDTCTDTTHTHTQAEGIGREGQRKDKQTVYY